ncbi:unnamed protein product, partial [Rotaria sp. Silwood1]
MDTDLPQITTAGVDNRITTHLQELYETLSTVSDAMETLNDDGQGLSNELLQCQIKQQRLVQEFSQVKLALEETNSFVQGLKPNQDILHQDLVSYKQEIKIIILS